MTPEGKRTEFRPLSDHDGLIGQDKTIMRMMIIGQDWKIELMRLSPMRAYPSKED